MKSVKFLVLIALVFSVSGCGWLWGGCHGSRHGHHESRSVEQNSAVGAEGE